MDTKIVGGVIGVVIVVGVVFYGGMMYGKNDLRKNVRQFSNGQVQSAGTAFSNMPRMRGNTAGFIGGEILSKDAESVTIKMQDGSTKIVLISESTEVAKSVRGTRGDLSVGVFITVNGSANGDGSLSAQSIQIRPEALIR